MTKMNAAIYILFFCGIMLTGAWNPKRSGERLHLFRCRHLVNGCTNLGLFRTYEVTFSPACGIHDVCYACGKTYNISRAQCDNRFFNSMVAICRKQKSSGCHTHAWLYYYGTNLFGNPFYSIRTNRECSKKCVKVLLRI